MEGQRLGKYEIIKAIGKGAAGTVWRARDPVIDRIVAIKTVKLEADDAEAEEEIRRFKREAQAAGRLSHPNIVAVYDYGEQDHLAYIVMEHVDGGSLKNRLDAGERLPIEQTVRVMEELLAALAHAHQKGVVHRDIKPANMMLTAAGQVKVADFGIARIESSTMTQAGTVLGTPSYMSPEQFRGEPVDARTDIYSAGVVLYQLLTGDKPFEGNLTAIMHKVLTVEPPKPSDIAMNVPAAMDAVVRKAMAKRPAERFADAAAFRTALSTALRDAEAADPLLGLLGEDAEATVITRAPQGAPAQAAAPHAAAPPPSARKGAPLGLILGGVGVAAAAGVAAFLFLGQGEETPAPVPSPATNIATAPPPPPVSIAPPVVLAPPPPQPEPQRAEPRSEPRSEPRPEPRPEPRTEQSAQHTQPASPPPATPPSAEPPPPAPASQAAPPPAPPVPTPQREAAPSPAPPPATPAPSLPPPPAARADTPIAAPPAAPPPPIVQAPIVPAPFVPAPFVPAPIVQPPVAAAPPPQPPAPPPQQLAAGPSAGALRATIAGVLADARCTLVSGDVAPDGHASLSGYAQAGSGEAALRLRLASAGVSPGRLDWGVRGFDGPYCGALDLLRPHADGFGATPSGLDLALPGGKRRLVLGDLLTVNLTLPTFTSVLRVSYFTHDGEVVHLHPTPADPARTFGPGARLALGDPNSGGPRWEVGPPYGTEMIVAIASERPLFAQARPEAEQSDAYLAALAEALRSGAGGRVAARALMIDIAER